LVVVSFQNTNYKERHFYSCSPQAKGGQRGKGPVKKQSREEKTQGGKEQEEEERPGRVAIHARNWERRFRQEILVANVLVPASNVGDREFIGAFSLALMRAHCRSVDGGPVSIRGELASWHSTFGWRR